MYVRFAAPELSQLDELRCDALAVPFFSDERPLQGVGGLVDWRLCGLLSRWIAAGRIEGGDDEVVLVPSGRRLPFETIWFFGLGPSDAFADARMEHHVARMLHTLTSSRARALALVLPGRNTNVGNPAAAMEALVATAGDREDDELVVLETPDAQKAMEPVIARERRRQRARDYA